MQGGVVLIEPVLGEASPSHRNPRTGEGNDAGLKKPAWFLLATTLMMCFVLLSCVDKNYQTLNKGEKKKSLSDLESVRSLIFISFPSAGDAGQFWVLFIVRFT